MNIIFCLVSLLGAFLLFQIQPIISKFILPWFGGSPGVWTTCMLFFQVVLFGGYSYAHVLAQRKPKTQAWIHGLALLGAALLLPIVPDTFLKPTGAEEPVTRILMLLVITVGLPYLVLSATSPLIQVWFSHRFPQRSPWRLYSLSNIGSLTALLSYPVLIESRWDVLTQARIWSWMFVVFAVLIGVCAFVNQARGNEITPEADPHQKAAVHKGKPSWYQRAQWLALPAFASLMLLATTNHVCMDVAVIPFLWILPLSLYLLSFIICFDHPRWYRRAIWAPPAMVLVFLAAGMHDLPWDWSPGFIADLVVNVGAMFFVCMFCHGELARLKPDTRHLTEYYLLMSAGGALGGLAVSGLAPLIFDRFIEWSLALLIGFALVTWMSFRALSPKWRGLKLTLWRFGWLSVALGGLTAIGIWEFTASGDWVRVRNFYGVLSINDYTDDDTGEEFRSFRCNGTVHGRQSLTNPRVPLTYYGHATGVGIALDSLAENPAARVGVIGMGAGTVACYAEKGQTYRFYEINPAAVDFAENQFTFTSDLQARGAIYELALGDARLKLEHEPPQNFDVLLIDAFSGDSVPVHLLTREAFELYVHHLKPNGIIAVHVTNHSLNLAPVVERAAKEFGLTPIRITTEHPGSTSGEYRTDYVLLTRDQAFVAAHPPVLPSYAKDIDVPLWTDHRHNLFQILQNR
jgi:hypothetical protein